MSKTAKTKRNGQRTDEERCRQIRFWYHKLIESTESFEGEVGLQLAYLWPAIAKGTAIELTRKDPLLKLLREIAPSKDATIWDYVIISGE